MAKATKATVTRRKVLKLLLNGSSRADILQYSSKNGMSRLGYIKAAKEKIIASSAIKNDLEIGLARLRLGDLSHRNMKIADYKGALAVLKESNKLLGLYPAKSKHIEVTAHVDTLTDEQQLERIEAILDKARQSRARAMLKQ